MDNQELRIETAKEIAEEGILLLSENKVRNHKLGNSARIHTGQDEKEEYYIYRNFLPTKMACIIYNLIGSDNNE